jgi:LEA14-like dessication related protein
MVDAKAVLGLVGKGFAVVFAFLVVSSTVVGGAIAGGVVEVGRPSVDQVTTEWGTVDADETEIEATVEVNNPNPVGVPAILGVEYTLNMNDVTVAEGTKEGVGVSSGSNDIDFEAEIDNDEVSDWWVSHVNNGEKTSVDISATVNSPVYSKQFDVKSQTVQTDFLSNLEGNGGQTMTAAGRQVAVTKKTEVKWGKADAETTPVEVSVTVKNTASESVSIRRLGYSVKFNDVTLGQGTAPESYTLSPGEQQTLTFTLQLDTEKVEDWWPTHVKAADGTEAEQTRVRTSARATVEVNGRTDRVRLDSMTTESYFKTDIVVDRDEESEN